MAGDVCAVCADTLKWVAYGPCGHKDVCSTCVCVHLRFSCNDSRCSTCKTQSDVVFVTKALGDNTHTINDFSTFPRNPKEGRVGQYWYHEDTQAFFDDEEQYRAIKAMCRLSMPKCRFCQSHFAGDNELYDHLTKEHYTCHICQREQPDQYEFYKDYDDLEMHLRREHFLCDADTCFARNGNKFIVFASESELKRHDAVIHPGRRVSKFERSVALEGPPNSFRFCHAPRPSFQRNTSQNQFFDATESESHLQAMSLSKNELFAESEFPSLPVASPSSQVHYPNSMAVSSSYLAVARCPPQPKVFGPKWVRDLILAPGGCREMQYIDRISGDVLLVGPPKGWKTDYIENDMFLTVEARLIGKRILHDNIVAFMLGKPYEGSVCEGEIGIDLVYFNRLVPFPSPTKDALEVYLDAYMNRLVKQLTEDKVAEKDIEKFNHNRKAVKDYLVLNRDEMDFFMGFKGYVRGKVGSIVTAHYKKGRYKAPTLMYLTSGLKIVEEEYD